MKLKRKHKRLKKISKKLLELLNQRKSLSRAKMDKKRKKSNF